MSDWSSDGALPICLADAGSGGSSRDSVVSGVAAEACAALEDMALEKPGTMATTSVPSIANRLACIQWRRVQRPLKPAGSAAARPFPFREAARSVRGTGERLGGEGGVGGW